MKKTWELIACIFIGLLGTIVLLRRDKTGEDSFSAFLLTFGIVLLVCVALAGLIMFFLNTSNRDVEEGSVIKLREDYIGNLVFCVIFGGIIVLFILQFFDYFRTEETSSPANASICLMIAVYAYIYFKHIRTCRKMRNELRTAEEHMRAYVYTQGPR